MVAEDLYEVFDWWMVAVHRTVILHLPRIATHISCKHACSVVCFMQQSIANYVDYHMTVESFKLNYEPTLYPIPDFDKPKVYLSTFGYMYPLLLFVVCICRLSKNNYWTLSLRRRPRAKRECHVSTQTRISRSLLNVEVAFPKLRRGPRSQHECHALLPKIRGNGVATKVGDVYTREKYPTHIR